MALTTYSDLKSAVTNWSHRSDLAGVMDDLVLVAEQWIFRNVRIREMETALAATISGVTAAVPSDFLGLRHAYIDAARKYPLEVVAPDVIYKRYPTSETGLPAYIAVDRASFVFGPSPAEANVVRGTYFAKPTPLATAANTIFAVHPEIYLFATLAELEPYTENDARVPLWQMKRDELTRAANGNATAQRFSGPITMKVA
jgi:hypothetical protein